MHRVPDPLPVPGDRSLGFGPRRRTFAARVTYYTVVPAVGVFAGLLAGVGVAGMERTAIDPAERARRARNHVAHRHHLQRPAADLHPARARGARAGAIAREEARVAAAEKEDHARAHAAARSAGRAALPLQHAGARRELIDAEPPLAKRMLERLIALLRADGGAAQCRRRRCGGAGRAPARLSRHPRDCAWARACVVDRRPARLAALTSRRCCCSRSSRTRSSTGSSPSIDGGTRRRHRARDGGSARADRHRHRRWVLATPRPAVDRPRPANLRARLAALFGAPALGHASPTTRRAARASTICAAAAAIGTLNP